MEKSQSVLGILAKKNQVRWGITLVCFFMVLLLGVTAVMFSEATKNVMGLLFDFAVFKAGSAYLWYIFLGTILIIWLCFSKYGNVYLGGSKPKFSKFQLFAMALSAGMGASTLYWGFIETVYYYLDPQFGIVDNAQKLEFATAYNLFHWGPAGWVAYLMSAIPFIFVFYVKKNRNMSLSGVINVLFDGKLPRWVENLLDLLFILTTLGATALTLGLAIPMISSVVSNVTGIPNTLTLGIGIILGLSLVFSLSSYVGMEKGMAKLSNWTVYICIGMIAIIFVGGPSALILNNTTNAIGITLQNYIRFSLNTDSFGHTGFPQYWTIFFFANWISYAPGMGIFITKIVKGHKLKDIIIVLIGAGSLGTSIIFGVLGTFTQDLMNNKVVDAVGLIQSSNPSGLVSEVLSQTAFPLVMMLIYLITMILFTVTTLDGTSFSLASIASIKVDDSGNVPPMFRLFWCLLLTVIPIVFLIIGADLNILKSFPVLMVLPMLPILLIILYKSYIGMRKEYGQLSANEIEKITK